MRVLAHFQEGLRILFHFRSGKVIFNLGNIGYVYSERRNKSWLLWTPLRRR